jgi:hypothetical protein
VDEHALSEQALSGAPMSAHVPGGEPAPVSTEPAPASALPVDPAVRRRLVRAIAAALRAERRTHERVEARRKLR